MVSAQLVVRVSPVKVVGQKAVVPLAMKNNFTNKIESARATVFLTDEHGKIVGQGTKWVIGASDNRGSLASKATNAFHFVVVADKPFATTNLAPKVSFTRLVLEGGKLADVNKVVIVQHAERD